MTVRHVNAVSQVEQILSNQEQSRRNHSGRLGTIQNSLKIAITLMIRVLERFVRVIFEREIIQLFGISHSPIGPPYLIPLDWSEWTVLGNLVGTFASRSLWDKRKRRRDAKTGISRKNNGATRTKSLRLSPRLKERGRKRFPRLELVARKYLIGLEYRCRSAKRKCAQRYLSLIREKCRRIVRSAPRSIEKHHLHNGGSERVWGRLVRALAFLSNL